MAVRPSMKLEDLRDMLVVLGRNSEAYFRKHKSAPWSTVATAFLVMDGGRRDLAAVLVRQVKWGKFDDLGDFVPYAWVVDGGLMEAACVQYPRITDRGYRTLVDLKVVTEG